MKKDSISCRGNIYLKITWKVIVTCVVKRDMIYELELNDILHVYSTTHKPSTLTQTVLGNPYLDNNHHPLSPQGPCWAKGLEMGLKISTPFNPSSSAWNLHPFVDGFRSTSPYPVVQQGYQMLTRMDKLNKVFLAKHKKGKKVFKRPCSLVQGPPACALLWIGSWFTSSKSAGLLFCFLLSVVALVCWSSIPCSLTCDKLSRSLKHFFLPFYAFLRRAYSVCPS